MQVLQATKPGLQFIGSLPADLHLLILSYLPIPDVATYARVSRATWKLAVDQRLWERRWGELAVERLNFGDVLDMLERVKGESKRSSGPATIAVSSLDDDEFGDFASASSPAPHLLLDLGALGDTFKVGMTPSTFRMKYIHAHLLLLPLLSLTNSSTHAILASIASFTSSLYTQARILHLLTRFLSPAIKPVGSWDLRLSSLKTSIDRFDAGLLTAFDIAESEDDEQRMAEVATASWEVWICLHSGKTSGPREEWEMGRVWAEKQEVLYEQGRWDPLANMTCVRLELGCP